jgi:hypothetical protein
MNSSLSNVRNESDMFDDEAFYMIGGTALTFDLIEHFVSSIDCGPIAATAVLMT